MQNGYRYCNDFKRIHDLSRLEKKLHMKSFILLICSCCWMSMAFGQTHKQWSITEYPDSVGQNSNLYGFEVDQQGNSFCIQHEVHTTNFSDLYRLISYNPLGQQRWKVGSDTCNGLTCYSSYLSLVPDEQGGVFAFSKFEKLIGPISQFMIRLEHINASGTVLWTNDSFNFITYGVESVKPHLDKNGDLVVAMNGILDLNQFSDFCFAKFDTTNGNTIWHIEIPDQGPSAGPLGEGITSFELDNNNNLCFVGQGINSGILVFRNYRGKILSNGTLDYLLYNNFSGIITFGSGANQLLWHANDEAYILLSDQLSRIEKLDPSTGAISWTKQITHDSAKVATFSIQEYQQTYYAFSNLRYQILDSSFQGFHYTPWQLMITKFDANAGTVWEKIIDVSNDTSLHDVKTTQIQFCDHAIYAAGTMYNANLSNDPLITLSKMDTLANIIWLDTTITDIATAGNIQCDSACHVYMGLGLNNTYKVIKYGDSVIVNPNGVAEVNAPLWQAYPNPVSSMLYLRELPRASLVQLINLNGTVLKSNLVSGDRLELDVHSLVPGIYIVKITSGRAVEYRKIRKE